MYYLDTSAFLQWVFLEKADFSRPSGEKIVTSELLRVESHRTFHRLRLENRIDDEKFVKLETTFSDFWDSIYTVFPDEQILNLAARSFPTNIGTLDAIHLSTAILFQEVKKEILTVITDDKQLSTTAKACGFKVVGHNLK